MQGPRGSGDGWAATWWTGDPAQWQGVLKGHFESMNQNLPPRCPLPPELSWSHRPQPRPGAAQLPCCPSGHLQRLLSCFSSSQQRFLFFLFLGGSSHARSLNLLVCWGEDKPFQALNLGFQTLNLISLPNSQSSGGKGLHWCEGTRASGVLSPQ